MARPMLRRQIPAYSPVSLRGLVGGLRAALVPRRAGEAAVREALARRFAATRVVLTDSGTSALALAIAGALRSRPRSHVALPAFGCYDLATAADRADAPVLLYDVDPATLAPDSASLARVLAQGVSAIVVAHLYGYPVDVASVQHEALVSGALVIEDAAQAAGATLHGRPAGALGSLTVLSFGRGKGTTGGGGGALLARQAEAAEVGRWAEQQLGPGARGIGAVGALAAQWALARPWLYWLPASMPFLRLGETVYHKPWPPRRVAASALGALPCALGLDGPEVASRRRNATRLLERIAQSGALTPVRSLAGAEPGFLRLPALVDRSARAAACAGGRRLGVMPGYELALADLPGFAARVANARDGFPGARTLAARLVTLPTHSRLTAADLRRLETWIARPS